MNVDGVHDFYQFSNDDFRAIICSKRGKHVYASQISNEGTWCACTGFRVHKSCYHLKKLNKLIIEFGEHKNMISENYPVSVDAINKALMGGIPKGTLVGFYGKPQFGKTTTAIWSLLDIMADTKKNGVFIDTETGTGKFFIPDLLKRFNKNNGSDIGVKIIKIDYRKWLKHKSGILPYKIRFDDGKDHQIVVIDIGNLKEMFLLVGRPYNIDLDSAKPTVQSYDTDLWQNIWDIPLAQILDDPNSETEYCGFVLDSLTNLMKPFGTANQAYPARDTAQSVLINQLAELIDYYEDMIGINILHASSPPADSKKRAIPVGGKSVGHGHKFIVQFSDAEEQGLNTIIHIRTYRLPTKQGNKTGYSLTINNNGVM